MGYLSVMFFTPEAKIRKEIERRAYEQAKVLASEAYAKDVAFRSLQASDLHYAIIQDLIQAAKLTGRVTVKLKDGSEIIIESKGDREILNGSGGLF